jgi:hypothetical protein
MTMRAVFIGVLLLGAASLGTGCVVLEKRPGVLAAPASPSCHPSQYWDGAQCRHKGKGHGARKHDGPPGKGKKR